MCDIVTQFCETLLTILKRLKSQMAALVAWIVGTITGGRSDEKNQEHEKKTTNETEKLKNKKPKVKPKRSTTSEPSFSTTLTTPIEEVIEETLNEEVKSANVKPSNKPKKRTKTRTKSKSTEHVDDVGFSFFKTKSAETISKSNLKGDSKTTDVSSDSSTSPRDPVGFSFLPVQDRRKKKNQKPKVDDLPKSSLIEHYQLKKNNRQTPVEEFVVVQNVQKLTHPVKKTSQDNVIEIVNKETGKTVYLEAKESKKVHAKISYASVTSQRFEESLEQLKQEEEKLEKEKERLKELEACIIVEENHFVQDTAEEIFKSNCGIHIESETKEAFEVLNVKECVEELVSEIQSEERRLVDLIEEEDDQKRIEDVIENIVNLSSTVEELKTNIYKNDLNEIETNGIHREEEAVEQSEVDTQIDTQIQINGVNSTEEITEDLNKENKKVISDPIEEVQRDNNIEDREQNTTPVKELVDSHSDTEVIESEDFDNKNCQLDLSYQEHQEIDTATEETNINSVSEETVKTIEEIDVQLDLKAEQEILGCIKTVENYYSEAETINNQTEINIVDNPLYFGSTEENKDYINEAETLESDKEDQKVSNQELDEVLKEEEEGESQTCTIENQKSYIDSNSQEVENTETSEQNPVAYVEELTDSKPFKMSAGTQIRVLTLNDKEHQDSTLYRIQKNWILQFRLGPSLLGRKVSLYCNYPKENQEFERTSYHLLKWRQDEGCNYSDDTALLTEITVMISGSFHYYFVYEDSDPEEHQGSGFFLVDPVLKYGNNEELPLDCIQCQTVLAKGLGPFDLWEKKLEVGKESGYNVIHFTPIQELGASNSSYSLSEQLKVNPIFTKQNGEETTFADIEKLVEKMRTEWKVASICDIVLNHTANESEWLKQHPEVTYNCQTCPYMRPAYLLDASFHQFSIEVSKASYEDKGIPIEVSTEEHLNAIRYYLQSEIFPKIKIHELYMCDVDKYVREFLHLVRNKVRPNQRNSSTDEELTLIQDPLYRRLSSTVDLNLALKLYNVYRNDSFDEETRIKKCAEDFKNKLESMNQKVIDEVEGHLSAAIDNVIAGIRYFRVQHDGPKIKEISIKNPLVHRYFTDHGTPTSIKEHEDIMYSDDGKFLMAHNGWVMNSDPLRNFAAPGSNVYIRRELIAWGDSVKLRYGDKPEDSPYLWEHMRAYVEQTAKIFDGVRLDNCHSTPIPVAEYLLDCARKVRPDLYVVAELFTNSDMTDNIFVNRLGITSLIREAMSAWDSHEQGRLVYRYGGSPVGSFYQPRIRPLVPSIAHALFLDLTHDNPSPVEKRSVFDLLPSTALVNMACCASGSNRGYDELVPHHIHVVDETRQYTEWSDDDNLAMGNSRYVTKKSGIIAAKKALNDLHFHLGKEGFDQVYVDQMDPDVVAVTRHCPETHQSYVLVAFTAFGHPPEDAANYQRGIRPLRVEGVLDEIVLEATLDHIKSSGSKYAKTQDFHKDSKWINGLSEYQVHINEHLQPENSEIFEKVDSGSPNVIQLNFKNFKPGSVAVIRVSLPDEMKAAIANVRKLISQFSVKKGTELWRIISQLTLPDLNRTLYRCDQEERDEGHGFDTYNIPNFGSLVYAGFQGFMSLLSTIRPNNDLGHPMCGNLRDGNWMIDYIWQRLKLDEGTKPLGQWFEENTKSLKSIPRYLVPCYFDVIVTGIYILLIEQSYNLMSDFVKKGSTFVKGLSLGSLQMAGYIKSADLPVLSPNLADPKPPQRKNEKGENVQACVTLSAGLPHFAIGYMRNWGRDTFIALRGLFLLTGRYQDARYHILGYAACLRHGLIPNLLDGGRNPRFNCRDAIWWWLYCIKCYTEDAPNGLAILTDKVSRIFPTDDSPAQAPGTHDQLLHDVIQEGLKVHFQGLVFRERNAGKQIDEHMSDQGFNNQIGIHPETGFVFGGNVLNCGTWMDKMGSSDKAGNRGKPATPRDGSAIELIGLSKAVVTWLHKLHKQGVYPHEGVERTGKNGVITKWTFKEWADKIQNNFEKYFWVNTSPVEGEIRPDLINKRGIYKDCYGASQEWTDFQLRCNFPIAMVAAPELFDPKHAWVALKQAEKYLLGPLGMKTLDPEDWAYNGFYDNSNDSVDVNVAHGWNYHQGPEWVWPVGFYLRARLQFARANGELTSTLNNTKVVLSRHFVELQTSTWRGLPELTNKDGAYCKDSSRTQAWSMSCILEVLHDLQQIEKDQPLIN